MATRAKFTCSKISKYISGGLLLYDATFTPVSSDTPENKEFWKWTPAGSISLSTIKELFEPGKNYYVDFIEAE